MIKSKSTPFNISPSFRAVLRRHSHTHSWIIQLDVSSSYKEHIEVSVFVMPHKPGEEEEGTGEDQSSRVGKRKGELKKSQRRERKVSGITWDRQRGRWLRRRRGAGKTLQKIKEFKIGLCSHGKSDKKLGQLLETLGRDVAVQSLLAESTTQDYMNQ